LVLGGLTPVKNNAGLYKRLSCRQSQNSKRGVMLRHAARLLLCMSCAGPFGTPAQALVLDLTSYGACGTVNGAIFRQFSSPGAGSGHIDAFLRIQNSGIEHGYNTDARPVEYDQKTSATFTRSLLLSSVPVVVENGICYRQFLLNINQNAESFLSLDALEIALHPLPGLYGYLHIFDDPVYDLDAGGDNWIKLGYDRDSGSGLTDMVLLIPDSLFPSSNAYVYLYSRFGEHFAANAGYEQWACRTNGSVSPEPVTMLLLTFGAALAARKPSGRKSPTTNDLG